MDTAIYTTIPIPQLQDRGAISTPVASALPPNALVYVFQSKGRKKKGRRSYLKARVVSDPAFGTNNTTDHYTNYELDIDRRVDVVYPLGSTFRVRRDELCPIFESSVDDPTFIFGSQNGTSRDTWRLAGTGGMDMMVLVCEETDCYRRLCMLHTTRTDTFLEIGCDYGYCIDAVLKSCAIEEPEPRRERDTPHSGDLRKVEDRIVGVDISNESIGKARESHEGMVFEVVDALSEEGLVDLKELCKKTLGGSPSVVAIDINGVREVEAVQKCVSNAMAFSPPPRLIIVKSRNLFKTF